jgi:hypothetical protein
LLSKSGPAQQDLIRKIQCSTHHSEVEVTSILILAAALLVVERSLVFDYLVEKSEFERDVCGEAASLPRRLTFIETVP